MLLQVTAIPPRLVGVPPLREHGAPRHLPQENHGSGYPHDGGAEAAGGGSLRERPGYPGYPHKVG
jgi:hypothetical protein